MARSDAEKKFSEAELAWKFRKEASACIKEHTHRNRDLLKSVKMNIKIRAANDKQIKGRKRGVPGINK